MTIAYSELPVKITMYQPGLMQTVVEADLELRCQLGKLEPVITDALMYERYTAHKVSSRRD